MIDRSIIPNTAIPNTLPVFAFQHDVLKNGVEVYMAKDEEELVRFSLYFRCGGLYSQEKGLVSGLSKLLLSGTPKYSAYEIQETLDFYGAYMDIESGFRFISVTVFCIEKHLKSVVSYLKDVLCSVAIPQEEFDLYQMKSIESLKVNEQKTSYLAKRIFNEQLFGAEHPYGRSMYRTDYENLSRDSVQNYYENSLINSLDYILVNTPVALEITQLFESFETETTNSAQSLSLNKKEAFTIHHQHQNAVQASIMAGILSPERKDKDYAVWSLLITLFGGYFGSRLMKNIREDKGYTYGISSINHHLPDISYMAIRSDVKNEAKEACMDEIFKEMERLKNEMVDAHELTTVKNYMLGNLQRGFDGSLALADRYKIILDSHLPNSYYQDYIQSIENVTPLSIQETANKYLDINHLNVVVVGDFK